MATVQTKLNIPVSRSVYGRVFGYPHSCSAGIVSNFRVPEDTGPREVNITDKTKFHIFGLDTPNIDPLDIGDEYYQWILSLYKNNSGGAWGGLDPDVFAFITQDMAFLSIFAVMMRKTTTGYCGSEYTTNKGQGSMSFTPYYSSDGYCPHTWVMTDRSETYGTGDGQGGFAFMEWLAKLAEELEGCNMTITPGSDSTYTRIDETPRKTMRTGIFEVRKEQYDAIRTVISNRFAEYLNLAQSELSKLQEAAAKEAA